MCVVLGQLPAAIDQLSISTVAIYRHLWLHHDPVRLAGEHGVCVRIHARRSTSPTAHASVGQLPQGRRSPLVRRRRLRGRQPSRPGPVQLARRHVDLPSR